ncbi:MAG: tetratricopeptide repeat protein [Chloroflexi bacterium]|nr:tetratricopeptide repeat protein [Chloroflexota bacterium]
MQQPKPVVVADPILDLAQRAVSHAKSGQWDDAVKANRALIALSPNDVEAHNRLGKALTELGRIIEAIAAFERARDLQPANQIAGRNLERLKQLESTPAGQTRVVGAQKPMATSFMAARGSTVLTELRRPAPARTLAAISPGDILRLDVKNLDVRVTTIRCEYLGTLEPKVAHRVARLIAGGNRYDTTVASFTHQTINVLVREIYRSPKQANITSFPPSLHHWAGDEETGPAQGEVRPELLLDRRAIRPEIVEEMDEDENPRVKPNGFERELMEFESDLEKVAGLPFDR